MRVRAFASLIPYVALLVSLYLLWHIVADPPSTFLRQNPNRPSLTTFNNCPHYGHYALEWHGPGSKGKLNLPYQRPQNSCRTYEVPEVESLIHHVKQKLTDPDWARLFENNFPLTLDTTIRWNQGEEGVFIVADDIHAEWLRDSTNQLATYAHLLPYSESLLKLFHGAIVTQAEYVSQYPYCNAFQPPSKSHLPPTFSGKIDVVTPEYDSGVVFEGKWELDSLAAFFKLSNIYYQHTNRLDFTRSRHAVWIKAIETAFSVLRQESLGTFDDEGNLIEPIYTFKRGTDKSTETLYLNGYGSPLNNKTGLIRSAFRPSGDAAMFGYVIPSNAMISVEVGKLEPLLKTLASEASGTTMETKLLKLSKEASSISKRVRQGILDHAVFEHPQFGQVFAYEIDGYGSRVYMDDANMPSLLGLPLLGFINMKNSTYQNTRRMVLSQEGNPFFKTGKEFSGIGGPSVGLSNAWPISAIVRCMTSDDENEIREQLRMLKHSTAGLGLMHESKINISYGVSKLNFFFLKVSNHLKSLFFLISRFKCG